MTSHTFTFAGNGSVGNRGCEAILRGTISGLEQIFKDSKFYNAYFADQVPDQKKGTWDANLIYLPLQRKNPRRQRAPLKWLHFYVLSKLSPFARKYYLFRNIKNVVQKSTAVFLVGGDNYSLDYGYPHLYFALAQMSLDLGSPTFLWGASVGPFSKDPEYEKFASEQLRKITRIYARESITIDYLNSIGVHENVLRTVDPAFLLEPRSCNFPEAVTEFIERGAVGMNISPLLAKYRPGESADTWLEKSSEIVHHLLQTFDLPILLIPHVMNQERNIQSDDHTFLTRVWEKLPIEDKGRSVVVGREYDAAETKWLISQLRFFIGARTHATIASLSTGVPTLVLAYSIKGKGIIRDIFQDDEWLLNVEEISSQMIERKLQSLIEKSESVRSQLGKMTGVLQMQALDTVRNVAGFIHHE